MNDQQKLLTQGSVWQLTKALGTEKNRSTVLCVTNTHLSEKLQERFPPVVVFFSKPGEFASMLVEDYVASRTLVDVDNAVSSLQFKDEPVAETAPKIQAGAEASVAPVRIAISHELEELLNTAFVSYEEAPDLVGGDTYHILTFDADEINFQDLISVFNQQISTGVVAFSLMGVANGDLDINIFAYVNTYLKTTSDGKQYAVVHLVSTGDFRAELDNRLLAEDKAKLAAARRAAQAMPLAEAPPQPVIDNSAILQASTAIPEGTQTAGSLVDATDPPFVIEG